MYCENCGKKLEDNAKFCAQCGTQIKEDAGISSEYIQKEIEGQEALQQESIIMRPEKKLRQKVMVVIAVIAVITAVLFTGFRIYTAPARQLERQLDLGNRYLDEMEYEQAIAAFDKALEIDPKNVDAYLGKADAYIGLDNYDMAIETLEAGYLETDENEEIKERLLGLYAEQVEEAIEKRAYEEGEKAYERIEELGGGDEELLKKLEELLGDENEEENIVQAVEEEEEELPYYELGFSPEDFTLAGYSVMDGNHAQDISEALDEIIYYTEEELPDNYKGWQWNWYWGAKGRSLYVEYIYDGYIIKDCAISYLIGEENENLVTLEIRDLYSAHEREGWPVDVLSKRPLFDAKVTMDKSSYEEVIDILGIQEVIRQKDESGGGSFDFESQYGKTKYYDSYYANGVPESLNFWAEEWSLQLMFYEDGILHSMKIEHL